MAKIKFFYDNLLKTYPPTETSEHVNFPVENVQHRDFNKAWRSNYGAGSGWGNFKIVAGVNDGIDFEETIGAQFNPTLTPGEYDTDELAAEMKTQMEAVGASTYTITYSDLTNKFTLASNRAGGGGTFKICWLTGINAATSVGTTVGFDVTADDLDAASHEADYVRIHSEERIIVDLTLTTDIYGIIIRGLNFSALAVVDAIFSADAWATIAEHPDFITQDDIMILEWDAPKNYRYVGVRIKNANNTDLYVKAGVLFIGPQFQPTENFLHEGEIQRVDPSIIMESESGQESTLQQESFDTWTYTFRVKGSTQKGYFDTMFNTVGTSKALFVCEDPSIPLTTTKYVRFTGWKWTPIRRDINLWYLSIGVKEQR